MLNIVDIIVLPNKIRLISLLNISAPTFLGLLFVIYWKFMQHCRKGGSFLIKDKWNRWYQGEEYVFGTEANVFLQDMQKKLQPSGKALAIAEGEGRNAVFLAESGMDVTMWELTEAGIEKAKKLADAKKVSVQTEVVDLEYANWLENQWDQIVFIFGHFPEPLRRKTLKGVKAAVKPGGYFVSEVYSQYQISYKTGGPDEASLMYKPEEFLDVFSDWRILHFFMGEVVRHEGDAHNGLSHVIQFAGVKPMD